MKGKLFSLAAAFVTAFACCGAVPAAAESAGSLKRNYANWRSSAFYDDGMLQTYISEMLYGAEVPEGYFLSADTSFSDLDYWYDSGALPGDSISLRLYANIPCGDSAVFYTKSEAESEAAAAVLAGHYPEHPDRYFRNGQTCFHLKDRNRAAIQAIRDELTDAGLIACFYENIPVYEQRQLTFPYLTGYSETQFYRPASPSPLNADDLQAYLDGKDLHCTVRTKTGTFSTVYYVVPDEKLSFQAHWALALQLYHDLGIVPDVTADLITQQTADPPKGAGVPYDINTDTVLNAGDAAVLAGYLLREEPVGDPEAGDMNADGSLSAADLTLLKRVLLAAEKLPEKPLIDPPVRALEPSMPSVGVNRIPVFAVEFPDCAFPDLDMEQLIRNRCFSATELEEDDYPYESIAAYFARASYGRMQLTGDVFRYQAEYPIGQYAGDYAQTLVDEVMAAFDAGTDFGRYDTDQNGILDSMLVILPDAALKTDSDGDRKPDWWPFSTESVGRNSYDGVRVGQYSVLAYNLMYPEDFVSQAAHELCHTMGLPDYYQYATETSSDRDGLDGEAGTELMDDGEGDLSACSKLLLGWYAPDEIQVYSGGTQTFYLRPSPASPSCVMIPKDPEAGFLSEYFLIEYITPDGNQPEFGGTGIRILHVDAAVSEGDFGPELTYSNNGRHYDSSNQKQRVLRLVNEKGYFYPGRKDIQYIETVDGSNADFRWYDENGSLTLETGLTIRINPLLSGPFANPDSPDPSAWLSGIAQITVSESE